MTDRFLAREDTTGETSSLTAAEATLLVDIFTSVLKGLAPPSGGGTTNFLRADGTWSAPVAVADTYPYQSFQLMLGGVS